MGGGWLVTLLAEQRMKSVSRAAGSAGLNFFPVALESLCIRGCTLLWNSTCIDRKTLYTFLLLVSLTIYPIAYT